MAIVPQSQTTRDIGDPLSQAELAVVLSDRSPARMTVPGLIIEEARLHRALSAGRRVSPDVAARLVAVTAALGREGGAL